MQEFSKKENRIIVIPAFILFFIVMDFSDNMVLENSRFWFYLISIIIASVFSGVIKLSGIKYSSSIFTRLLYIGCFVISPLLVGTVNKIKVSPAESHKVTVVNKYYKNKYSRSRYRDSETGSVRTRNRRKGTNYYLDVRDEKNHKASLKVNNNIWNRSDVGSKHVVRTKKGLLGLETDFRFY